MLATMCPDIVFARLPVILTCGIVTALLRFILIKIEFHSHPLSVGSHATKGIGYPMRVLISIVPSYTTQISLWIEEMHVLISWIGHTDLRAMAAEQSPAINKKISAVVG